MPEPQMPEADAVAILDALADAGVGIWVDGGWAVDALLGRQTRPHRDLDLTLEHCDEADLLATLGARGLREKDEPYARPFNYILEDDDGHEIDLHIVELDERGNGDYGGDGGKSYTASALSGRGTLGGRAVRCIAAAELVGFHTDYELRGSDFHDVALLCEAFDIPLPEEHRDR
ncbi:MAG TPA: aminoglycoside nucleotidyltransferase [Acidimicrobiia bacterium]|nr:aminoglycoside nucleotidyltransferase [Acidimicrobiia bacterium]